MTTTKQWTRALAAAALAAALAGATRADAQQVLDSVNVRALQTRADTLEFRAERLVQRMSTYRQAAYLYQMAAAARESGDPRGVSNLLTAGYLFEHIGDLNSARASLERAAARALTQGDVVTAAVAYVDAAYVAHDQGGLGRSAALAGKARALAASQFLTAEQRATIEHRLGEPAVVGMLGGK